MASTAIMHSSGGSSSVVAGGTVIPSSLTSSASSNGQSSSGCPSSSDEEEVGVLRVKEDHESIPTPPEELSDTHSDKENREEAQDEDNLALKKDEELKVEDKELLEEDQVQASPKAAASEDSASTIVGDDDEENSQQSIEVDDHDEPKESLKTSKSSKEESSPLPSSEEEVEVTSTKGSSSETENTASASLQLSLEQPSLFGSSTKTGSASRCGLLPKKAFATGKLERITAALAAKKHQPSTSDGRQLTNLLESSSSAFPMSSSAAALMLQQFTANSSFQPTNSATTISEEGDDDEAVNGMVHEDDDEEEDDDLDDEEGEEEEGLLMDDNGMAYGDDEDDEDDEEIKNGFRALGLMGNVAFMGEEKFKCPVCGIKLDSQHTFTLHIRSHNPNDHSNTCRLCGKTLSSASSLDRHMLIHSGERPFKCSICNMAFTTNGNMHRHMRTHGHGTIGYTPRGAKRRAKLFAQQAAKVAAAAAAGEPVDAATISKLKKSALEVTTGNGKSPISGTPMKRQRGSGAGGSGRKGGKDGGLSAYGDAFGSSLGEDEMMLGRGASSAENSAATLAEAEQIAAAAAAYAASVAVTSSSGSSDHHHHHQAKGSKKRDSSGNTTHHNRTSSSGSPFGHLAAPASHHQQQLQQHPNHHQSSPSHLHHLQQQQAAFNHLSNGWPGGPADLGLLSQAAAAAVAASSNNNNSSQAVVLPQKGKPGRKRKIRPEEAALMNANTSGSSRNDSSNSSFPAGAFSNLTGPTLCPICSRRLGSKMELHVHMAAFHGSEKLFCLDCGMILESYSVYTQHHCTVTAAAVMQALAANPTANPELLFRSTNTSRMNFSSARFPGSSGNGVSTNNSGSAHSMTGSGHHGRGNQGQQDTLSSLMSQLSKSSFFQQQPNSKNNNHNRGSTSNLQPIVDLSSKSKSSSSLSSSSSGGMPPPATTASAHQAAHHFGASGGPSCGQCERKFANTKLLKNHFDTFCHECSADCGSQGGLMSHQIQHSIEKFPNLSKALGNGNGSSGSGGKFASEGFNSAMAAALPGLFGMQAASAQNSGSSHVVGKVAANSTSRTNSPSPFNKRHSYPKQPSSANSTSLDLSVSTGGGSSMASLTSTMADMKPDLADIQSILSMAKHTKLALPGTSSASYKQAGVAPLSLSPNRASDAGVDAQKASARSGGGQDAGSHPDSPASADSAAAAVAAAASNGPNHHNSQLATSSLTSGHTQDKNGHESAQGVVESLDKPAGGDDDEVDHHHQDGHEQTTEDDDYLEAEEDEEDEEEEGEEDEEMDVEVDADCELGTPTKSSPGKRRRRGSNSEGAPSPTKKTRKEGNNSNSQLHTGSAQNEHHSPSSTSGNQQRFRCEQCRLSFKSMNAFRRHNRGHTAGGGHSHACHLCPYKSLDKSTLIRHLRTHNGERPFQCAICKYAFTTKANCERHVRKRHRNLQSKGEIRAAMQYNRDMAATAAATRMVSEKIFIERDELPTSQDTVCKQCSVDFTTNRQLRAHLRVPNNPCSQQLKPFVCTICKIGFNTRNNCVRHIIKQHPATIECDGDEEAATKLISAVTSATGALGGEMTAESLIGAAESGSSASLSPGGRSTGSGGQGGGSGKRSSSNQHNTVSDRGEPFTDEDECESSYGTANSLLDEDQSQPKNRSSPLASPSVSNASFAALCQVAAVEAKSRIPSKEGHLKSLAEGAPPKTCAFTALNLSVRESDEDDEGRGEDVLDLSAKPTRVRKTSSGHLANGSLDLSVKVSPSPKSTTLLNGSSMMINSMPKSFDHHHQQIPPASLRQFLPPSGHHPLVDQQLSSAVSGGMDPTMLATLMRHHQPQPSFLSPSASSTASLLALYKQQQSEVAEHHHHQQQVAAALAYAQQQQQALDMNAMAAAFAKYGAASLPSSAAPAVSNEALANLMAQFHQHQTAFAALKAPMAKNH